MRSYPAREAGQGSERAVRADEEVIRRQAAATAPKVPSLNDEDGHFSPEDPLKAKTVFSLRVDLKMCFKRVDNVGVEGNTFVYIRSARS
ncbi:MAG: hypothetical protein OXN89_16245 [Bryobacterales bacterium]|nr:hypothetical protein [Bryobacterales bacterium]